MVRFLLVMAVLCFAGCGKSQFHAKADALIEKLKQDNAEIETSIAKIEAQTKVLQEINREEFSDVKRHRPVVLFEPSQPVADQPFDESKSESDSDSDSIKLAAVQSEYHEVLSQAVTIDNQVRQKSLELASLIKLKKLTDDNLSALRTEVDRLMTEQNEADKAKQEAEAIRDNNISQNWRDSDVYAPGLVVPTGDR